jgi:hypothetical protein
VGVGPWISSPDVASGPDRDELLSALRGGGTYDFFLSLLLMVWGGLRLIITVFLRVAIIVRYQGCRVWVLIVFWGTLFQLAVSPFNWIDRVMEDVGRRVGVMLDSEAA